jgi:hypothetical protein
MFILTSPIGGQIHYLDLRNTRYVFMWMYLPIIWNVLFARSDFDGGVGNKMATFQGQKIQLLFTSY